MDWPTFKVSEHNGGKMIITAKMRALVWMKMVHSSSYYYSPSVDTSPILWPTLEIGSKSLIYSNTLFSFFFTYFHLCHHLNGYNSLMDFQILQHFSLALQYSHNDWYNCHLHISQPSRFPGKVEIFLFFFLFFFSPYSGMQSKFALLEPKAVVAITFLLFLLLLLLPSTIISLKSGYLGVTFLAVFCTMY